MREQEPRGVSPRLPYPLVAQPQQGMPMASNRETNRANPRRRGQVTSEEPVTLYGSILSPEDEGTCRIRKHGGGCQGVARGGT